MNGKSVSPISRREFARRAAIVSAASMVPSTALSEPSSIPGSAPSQAPDTSSLTPESQIEAEARYQAILSTYSSRFSDAQKAELRRLCFAVQPSLDRLRAYPLENGDGPALYLKPLVEREKKSTPASVLPPPIPATKKS